MPSSKHPRQVREPIQVYLSAVERATLDQLAQQLKVSRAEALRRGITALAVRQGETLYDALTPLVGSLAGPGVPPDLALHHDRYLAKPSKQRAVRSKRRSS